MEPEQANKLLFGNVFGHEDTVILAQYYSILVMIGLHRLSKILPSALLCMVLQANGQMENRTILERVETPQKQEKYIRAAIQGRRPLGPTERYIVELFGQQTGYEVNIIHGISVGQNADLVKNGTLDIATSGPMNSFYSGKGNSLIRVPITNHHFDISVQYTSFICDVTLQLVVPKRQFVPPYTNLIRPYSGVVWAVIFATVGVMILVKLNNRSKMSSS